MKNLLILLLLISTTHAYSYNYPTELVIYDSPFNQVHNKYNAPSMAQSLNATKSFYNLAHKGLDAWAKNNGHSQSLYTGLFDFLWSSYPIGTAWLHEEYHRAVLSSEGIGSFNDVNRWQPSDIIAVGHIEDYELANFKRRNNPGFVRMSAAGMEAQTHYNLEVTQDYHFKKGNKQVFNQLFNALNNSGYMSACTNSDTRINESNDEDGTNIKKRDFTGFDCLAWVYDLNHPDEPYSARGTHPSGVGIDRYIKYSDLSDSEKDYLDLNIKLSYLNLINPIFIGKDHFTTQNIDWNFSLAHYMTSFGHAVDLNLFFLSNLNAQFTIHNYTNKSTSFPGFETILFDQEINKNWLSDLRLMLWSQPDKQLFREKNGSLGGLISSKFKYKYKENQLPYFEIEQKTQGWVAGNVFLDPAFSAKIGYEYIF